MLGSPLGAASGGGSGAGHPVDPVALAPFARAQMAGGISSAQADVVVRAADALERSALAGRSNATNPIKASRLVGISGDIIEILSSDRMRGLFLASRVMQRIDAMPGVKRVLDIINADAEPVAVLGEGATGHAAVTLVRSDTVMRAIDESGVTAEAIEAARRSVRKSM